ncbi:hypothetical protein [Haladaptatus sp. NG-WS-4]
MKKGALSSGGLAIGLSGATNAQTTTQGNDQPVGVMLSSQFSGGARFTIASQALNWAPIRSDNRGRQYNTRVISYQYSQGAYSMLFLPENVDVQQGQTYQFASQPGNVNFNQNAVDDDILFDDSNELGLVAVQFSPVQGGETTQGGGNQTQSGNQTTTQDGGS